MRDSFEIIAEWAEGATPSKPGPWTRSTLKSAVNFVNHNVRGEQFGLLSMEVYEDRGDGQRTRVYHKQTPDGESVAR